MRPTMAAASFSASATRLLAEKLPKASDILMQLAHDEIRSIPADISFLGGVFRRKQTGARGIGIDQRPTGIFSVFVPIPEQELAEGSDVGVVTLKTERRLELENGKKRSAHTLLRPIDLRLTDSVGEAERFEPVKV